MRIAGIRAQGLVTFYGARLRQHPVQELLAAAGIAVGVALVFAVQVANSSITGSAEKIVRGITGTATLQVATRSDRGFDDALVVRVERLSGVRQVAPLLRSRAELVGPRGRTSIDLAGATPALAGLRGLLTENFGPRGLRLVGGLLLPGPVARATGARAGGSALLLADGRARRATVSAVLQSDSLGALANSRMALAPLELAQQLTGRAGRVSHLLVEPVPGRAPDVSRAIERLAGGRLTVGPATSELEVLKQAAAPNDRSTSLFAAISAMVGFLFAFNAMLFTIAERRRFVADLRLEGAAPRQIVTVIVFEALVLGIVASLAGLALGALLSKVLFGNVPDYLVLAFPIGAQQVVELRDVAFAFGAGMVAALAASVRPLLDLRPGLPVDAVHREGSEAGEAIAPNVVRWLAIGAVSLVCVTIAVVAVVPAATVVGGVTLALATVMTMPFILIQATNALERGTRSARSVAFVALPVMELRGSTTRSVALAAIAGVAVYGSVAIGGARTDLLRGLDRNASDWLANADVWVSSSPRDLMTTSFHGRRLEQRMAALPEVAAVRVHRGGFLDLGTRRVWVLGRPRDGRMMVPGSQLLEGGLDRATARLRDGGWATVSSAIAEERELEVGAPFTLPAATGPMRLRVAAITTNLGWVPGAIGVNADDYARAFATSAPSAYEVDLVQDDRTALGKRAIQAVAGPGLSVETRDERTEAYAALSRDGVARLSQISALLLVAAALAVASALVAMVWQRRPRLAALRVQGARVSQLWRSLLFETGFIVAIGCVVGAVLGVFGHLLAGRYLRLTTGFPAPFDPGLAQLVAVSASVAAIALLVSSIPGYFAARAPIRTGFQE